MQVALPLDPINAVSRRGWSIRNGHPGTPRHWRARPSPTAGRTVTFTQMADNPSAKSDGGDSGERARDRLPRYPEQPGRREDTGNDPVAGSQRAAGTNGPEPAERD